MLHAITLLGQERVGHCFRLLPLRLHFVVHARHVGIGDGPLQLQQLAAQLGVLFQRVLSHDVAAKIRRIEVPVVLQHHEALVGHLPVGGGHDDGIHLALEQRLVLQADVHVSRGAEVHAVGLLQSGVAVLPVEEVGLGPSVRPPAAPARSEYVRRL